MFLLPVEPDPAAVQHPGGAGRVAHLLLAGGGASSQHQQEEAEGGQEVPLPLSREETLELIALDVSRTFPQLCIFQKVR